MRTTGRSSGGRIGRKFAAVLVLAALVFFVIAAPVEAAGAARGLAGAAETAGQSLATFARELSGSPDPVGGDR